MNHKFLVLLLSTIEFAWIMGFYSLMYDGVSIIVGTYSYPSIYSLFMNFRRLHPIYLIFDVYVSNVQIIVNLWDALPWQISNVFQIEFIYLNW